MHANFYILSAALLFLIAGTWLVAYFFKAPKTTVNKETVKFTEITPNGEFHLPQAKRQSYANQHRQAIKARRLRIKSRK